MSDDENNTDKSNASIKPPKYFTINSNEDVASAWKLWLQQFEWYSIATNLESKKPAVQVAVFMSSIGPDATVIYNTFNLSESDSKSLKTIIKRFTAYFTPKINESYERYIFNSIVQKECQAFDEFVIELSDSLREKLLAEHNLTLDRTIDILCRSAEQVNMQVNAMKQTAIVDAITWYKRNTYKKKEQHEETFQCGRCDTVHGRINCPAYRKICNKCIRRNHFTQCCKIKTVDCLKTNEDEEQEFMVSSVYADKDVDVEDWYEQANLPSGVIVNLKLDSGSQCNVISQQVINRVDAHISPSTTRYLTYFSNHKIPVLGESKIETMIKGQQRLIKYLVVEEDVTGILGKSTCVKLNLMKRVEALEKDSLFEGISCLKQFKYDIDLVDNPKLSICPARRIPHTIRQQVKEELNSIVEQGIITPVTNSLRKL